jgi:hypothetical protein
MRCRNLISSTRLSLMMESTAKDNRSFVNCSQKLSSRGRKTLISCSYRVSIKDRSSADKLKGGGSVHRHDDSAMAASAPSRQTALE